MAVPMHQDMMLPALHTMADGQAYKTSTILDVLAEHFKLTTEELNEPLSETNSVLKFSYRFGWTCSYLKRAGVIVPVERGVFRITEAGRALLAENLDRVDNKILAARYPAFAVWWRGVGKKTQNQSTEPEAVADEPTPEMVAEVAEEEIREQLAAMLLEKVKTCSPGYFEWLVVTLLARMGYGGSLPEAEAALLTGKSGDGGIDGVIKQDHFGLEKIYIQAKRYTEANVGRPTVQSFVGALDGKRKGILFTTSSFSKEARDYAAKCEKTVILVDGEQLAELMLKFSLGVKPVTVMRIDDSFFGEA
jgi:restriction system protein